MPRSHLSYKDPIVIRDSSGSPLEHRDRPKRKRTRSRWLLDAVRYLLPAVVVLGGLVVMAFGDENHLEGGAGIVSAGLAIFFVNWLFRAGTSGDREREAEEAAREYFDRHGRWPSG